jgi:uncharacterized coiled-coil protein SlyX
MSVLTPKLDALEAAIGSLESRVSADIAALTQQIAELQAKIDAGTATEEEVARFDSLTQRLANVDPTISSPPPEEPPAP